MKETKGSFKNGKNRDPYLRDNGAVSEALRDHHGDIERRSLKGHTFLNRSIGESNLDWGLVGCRSGTSKFSR
jgi:hypothetical protein